MKLLQPVWPGAADRIGAVSTYRDGGESTTPYAAADGAGGLNLALHVGDDAQTVARNRATLRAHLPNEPLWLNQVHGITVVHAQAGMVVDYPPTADASIATEPGVVCAIMTADCLPVLLSDPSGRAVGAAHAGWRGLAGGVLQQTVNAMRDVGANEIMAWLGPAIGPHAFEVGAEVRTMFCDQNPEAERAFVARAEYPGKYLADLYALARLALGKVGVSAISGGDQCTLHQTENYFSFRRDQRCGRMASLIWIR